MSSNRERINSLTTELDSLKTQLTSIQTIVTKYSNLSEVFQQFETTLNTIKLSVDSIDSDIKETQESVDENAEAVLLSKDQVEKNLVETELTAKKINAVYDALFGGIDPANAKRTGGLYADIKNSIKETDERHSVEELAYNELYKKVESLLPGATSAGLAKAYADQKTTYTKPELIWSIVTVTAMLGITILGYITFLDANSVSGVTEAFALLIIRLPIFLGVTWLAIYSGKQQSQSGRLRQEYAHKETMARSLEGYKREIEGLRDNNPESVLNKFMSNAVDSVAFNPSTTLDKKHENKPPFVQSLINTFGRVEKNTKIVNTATSEEIKTAVATVKKP